MKFKFILPSWEWILSEQNNILTKAHNHITYEMKHNEMHGRNKCRTNSPYLILQENSSRFTLEVHRMSLKPMQFLWYTKKMYLVKYNTKLIMNFSLDSWKYDPKKMFQNALQWRKKELKKYTRSVIFMLFQLDITYT